MERQERATDQDVVSKMQRAYAFGRAAVKEYAELLLCRQVCSFEKSLFSSYFRSDLVEDRPAILKKPRIPPVKKAVRYASSNSLSGRSREFLYVEEGANPQSERSESDCF